MIRRILFWLAAGIAAGAVAVVIFTLIVYGMMGGFQ